MRGRFKPILGAVDLAKSKAEIWEIFKDSTQMYSDFSKKLAGRQYIDSADALYDLFFWTLHISGSSDFIGAYNEDFRLIGFFYVTHINFYDYFNEHKGMEAYFHGTMHPSFRAPKYTDSCAQSAISFFINKHKLNYLFSTMRADNRPASIAIRRNGFYEIEFLPSHMKHHGRRQDYVKYEYGGKYG